MRIARGISVGASLAARFHTTQKIADVEIRRITGDLGLLSDQERRRTGDNVPIITRLDPPFITFKSNRARTQLEPTLIAQNQLYTISIASVQLIVLRFVFDCGCLIGIVGPLAKVNAMGTPFQTAAPNEAAAFFEIEAIEQRFVVGSPGGGPEIQVPIDFLLVRLGLGRGPAATDGLQPSRVGIESLELAQLPAPGQIGGKGEIRQAAPLRARLEYAPRATECFSQRQALGDILGAGFLAIEVFSCIAR